MGWVYATGKGGKRRVVEESELTPDDVVATTAEDEPIRAGLLGTLRGVTFGLSDNLFRGESAKSAESLMKENPAASTAGNVTGTVAGMVALPELAAEGKAAKVFSSLAKNSLAGLGPQISESALENKPVNTELLAKDMMGSALLGAGTEGVLYGGGKLVSAALGKAGESLASTKFIDAANGLREKVLKKALNLSDDVFKYADSEGILAATSHQGVASLASAAAKKAASKATENIDDIIKALPDAEGMMKRWAELASEPATPASLKEMKAIEKEIVNVYPKAGEDVAGRLDHEAINNAIEREARDAHSIDQVNKASRHYDRQDRLREQMDIADRTNVLTETGKRLDTKAEGVRVRAPSDTVETSKVPGVNEPYVPEPFQPPHRIPYTPATVARQNAAEAFAQRADEFHKARSVYDAAMDAHTPFDFGKAASEAVLPGVFGGPKAAGMYAGSRFAQNQVKNSGGYIFAKGMEALAEGRILPKVLKGFQQRVDMMLQTAPGMLGPFAAALSAASAESPDALLAVHSKLAQSAQGEEYLARMGMQVEDAATTRSYGQKLAMLEALEKQRAQFERSIDKSVASFFSGKSDSMEAPAKVERMSKKDYETQLQRLTDIVRDPGKLAQNVPVDVRDGAPALTALAGQNAGAAAKFLYEKMPKREDGWKPKSLQLPYEPAPGELDKYARYAEAVRDPKSVALKLAAGQASPEGVEAIQTLYPNLFQKIQEQVMAKLVAMQKPLNYEKKALLAQTFGPQIMGVSPQQALYLQSVHQANAMQGPTSPQGTQNTGKPPSTDGRQMVNSNKNMMTQNQRIEARGQGNKNV